MGPPDFENNGNLMIGVGEITLVSERKLCLPVQHKFRVIVMMKKDSIKCAPVSKMLAPGTAPEKVQIITPVRAEEGSQ
jgi:hypothetical protein